MRKLLGVRYWTLWELLNRHLRNNALFSERWNLINFVKVCLLQVLLKVFFLFLVPFKCASAHIISMLFHPPAPFHASNVTLLTASTNQTRGEAPVTPRSAPVARSSCGRFLQAADAATLDPLRMSVSQIVSPHPHTNKPGVPLILPLASCPARPKYHKSPGSLRIKSARSSCIVQAEGADRVSGAAAYSHRAPVSFAVRCSCAFCLLAGRASSNHTLTSGTRPPSTAFWSQWGHTQRPFVLMESECMSKWSH